MYKVFKFGGSSIKDVANITNVSNILKSYSNDELVIIFSAMGKVTNMLEDVVELYIQKNGKPSIALQKVKNFHFDILNALFDQDHLIFEEINNLFVEIEWVLEEDPYNDYGYVYDQIVSIGEFLSTKIMSAYLNNIGFHNNYLDARDIIKTDNSYRNAKIDWETTTTCIKSMIKAKHCITQGFVGCTSENFTTTLGREGSDFTAAILAYGIEAKEVVIWKDVPGMMNADPKYFQHSKVLETISFDEAIELAYFGAKVIHPKTIQPLKKKKIPLRVRSFIEHKNKGSQIAEDVLTFPEVPSIIIKENQILISISDRSLSFIVETHMSKIFGLLAKHSVSVNVMQNSAVSFSVCVDDDKYKIPQLISDLQKDFEVYYNKNLTLYTVRNYTKDVVNDFFNGKEILLEQRSRNTLQLVVIDI
ncbi:MAG: aspartate kinase [Flavobacteriales bacterium]|nr:aspartate kinase [Flavobacteriales bacterium]|tara:strand:- start:6670 stop:7923 length:1254 start_codon:yes stop_codon:yes gene_type:complete